MARCSVLFPNGIFETWNIRTIKIRPEMRPCNSVV